MNPNVLASQVWAILPDRLEQMLALLPADPRDLLADADPEEVDAIYAARGMGAKAGSVAVIPVTGSISKRDSLLTQFFGGTSTTRLTQAIKQAVADDSVGRILLNVDSPGGTVSGLPELAQAIREARTVKPVTAIANDMAASAAYWIASQADEVWATPEAMVGSVGVFAMHVDYSGALEQQGIRPTMVSAGKYKTEANPYQPLSDEARGAIQTQVDHAYDLFVRDIAAGRSVTPAQVREGYGEGRVFTAQQARKAGMIDRVVTYSDAVKRLSGAAPAAGARAEDDEPVPEATVEPSPDRLIFDTDKWLLNR